MGSNVCCCEKIRHSGSFAKNKFSVRSYSALRLVRRDIITLNYIRDRKSCKLRIRSAFGGMRYLKLISLQNIVMKRYRGANIFLKFISTIQQTKLYFYYSTVFVSLSLITILYDVTSGLAADSTLRMITFQAK